MAMPSIMTRLNGGRGRSARMFSRRKRSFASASGTVSTGAVVR